MRPPSGGLLPSWCPGRHCLPAQETWVPSLVWEDPAAREQLSPRGTTSEPVPGAGSHSSRGPQAQTRAPQERPPLWAATTAASVASLLATRQKNQRHPVASWKQAHAIPEGAGLLLGLSLGRAHLSRPCGGLGGEERRAIANCSVWKFLVL